MKQLNTSINGLKILNPRRFADDRGYFCETWNRKAMDAVGIHVDFVQDNMSLSLKSGTVRGLHFQSPPFGQAKLVRCSRGRLFDVAVDIRKGSPTYGDWFGIELSAENGTQLFIPEGFLHGFITREDNTEICYKTGNFYSAACDGAVRWNDPDIGIDWGVDSDMIGAGLLSPKDAKAPFLKDFDSPFTFEVLP